MYKPNFCVECGTRIEHTRWRPWTSRQFCGACHKQLGKSRLVGPLSACVILVVTGFIVGRTASRVNAPPPLVIERSQSIISAVPLAAASSQMNSKAESEDGKAAGMSEQNYGLTGTANERRTDPSETVSICGARTQKGTPCSRRVRGAGRCWQHKGKTAMLPSAKLVVRE